MNDIRWKTAWFFCIFSLFCLVIGLISSSMTALVIFTLGLMSYIAYHVYWMHALQEWLKKPILSKIPVGGGIWEDVLAQLYKSHRKNLRQQTQLSAELARFRHAAGALPDGIIVLNARNEIEWCNVPAEQMLGLDIQKDLNKPINYLVRQQAFIDYLHEDNYEQLDPIKIQSPLQQSTLELQIVNYGKRQKLLISRDITQLERIDTVRRDFIANVSHELRTPLTVVGGFVETLMDMDGAIPDSTRTYFTMMQDQTNRMQTLINDLLVLSQIESNVQTPNDTVIKMDQLINSLVNDAKNLSQGRHNIQSTITPDLHITGDISEIQSALSNLISNAIRYSPEGGDIIVRWHTNHDHAIFSVQDHGIGIESEHIARIAERFYRVDKGRSRLTGGTGLGLSIVKHILSRHQAKLNVKSKYGQGSTFSVIFPTERIKWAKSVA